MAIQRVSADLKLSNPEMAAIIRAHDRRNDTSYRSPFPPLSKADAATQAASFALANRLRLTPSSAAWSASCRCTSGGMRTRNSPL